MTIAAVLAPISEDFVVPSDLSHRLESADAPVPRVQGLRQAAVVALLLPSRGQPERDPGVVLIERAATLRAHAGQLAFPGGKPEPEDGSLVETALREAEEEVGLVGRNEVDVLGRLHPVPTPTGFLIHPFVAWAPEGWVPTIASGEVHRVLTPRMSRLADPAVHRLTGTGVWKGYHYEMHEFAIFEPPLWGATARMVWDLLTRMDVVAQSEPRPRP